MRILCLLLLTILFYHFLPGCASIQTPTGGEKDTIPPKLLTVFPTNGSTQFRGLMLRLVFDEYINVQDLKKELIITPTPPGEMAFRSRAENLILTFDKAFDDSTTYSFNFRKGIKDVTEKNPAKNLTLSFSTGPKIDSLSLKGTVKHGLTLLPQKDCQVMLYLATDTLDFPQHKPLYLTQTNQSGEFEFSNLPAKPFKIYALSGNSLKYNRREQMVGFLAKPIRADSLKNLEIRVLDYDTKPLSFIRQKALGRNFEFQFNKTPLYFRAEFPTEYDSMISYVQDKSRVVFFALSDQFSDSLNCQFTAMDTVGNVIDSFAVIRFDSKAKIKKEKWEATLSQKLDVKFGDSINLEISLNQPFATFFPDSVLYEIEGDSVKKAIRLEIGKRRTSLKVSSFAVKSKHIVRLKKGALISLSGDTLPEQNYQINPKREQDFGTISGSVLTNEKKYTLQVLDEKLNVEAELFEPIDFKFEYLLPGKKRLRVLVDANGDGEWSRGDLKSRQPPEPVFILSKELILKANWELSENIITF